MIISYLCKYYNDVLKNKPDFIPEGYSKVKINYLVSLTEDGKIEGIIDLGNKEIKDKKIQYPEYLFPERCQISSIFSNIIEHRPLYIFGLVYDKKEKIYKADDSKAIKSITSFKKCNLEFIEGLESNPLIEAYKNFIKNWNPENETENQSLLSIAQDYEVSKFAFCLSGNISKKLNDDKVIKEKWEKVYETKNQQSEAESLTSECAIYGDNLPIACLHDKIKGVLGGQASGCVMVCVNNSSEESYGKKQSYNSNISNRAMKEYTKSLNYLLSEKKHHTFIDSVTVCHFAYSPNEDKYINIFDFLVGENVEKHIDKLDFAEEEDNKKLSGDETEKSLSSALEGIKRGEKPDFSVFDNLDENVEYCIFGLVPNSSRIAVKFCYMKTFGEIKRNIIKWNQDYSIENNMSAPPFWKIKKQLISPNASKEILAPDIIQSIMESVLNGQPLQKKVAEIMIRRIKTDSDTEKNHFIRMNDTRVGLLKAYLNRKNNKEIIKMGLDKDNKNVAYLCGRLFAILEKVQQDSVSGTLNKTIKDSFFSSACSTPAVVFARLFKLSHNHLAKLSEVSSRYYTIMIGEIMNDISIFPKTLPLDEQANFILGYYQQNKYLYTKKENKLEEN